MYQGFEQELARERVAQMRTEVKHNRLEARLGGEAVLRGGMLSRGTTFVAALFR